MVELAMDAEDEFGIALPDTALQDIATVGAFYDVIVPLVRANGAAELRVRDDLEQYLWSRVRVLAARPSAGVAPEHISRSTRFVEDLGYG